MEIAIGAISVVLGMALSYLGFMRNRDKDTIAKAKEEAQFDADLRHISRGVDEIRIDMRAHNKKTDEQLSEMQKSIVRNDESIRSAHKRLDKVEQKLN